MAEGKEQSKPDLVPRHTSEYSTKQYWDWRYEQEASTESEARHYDWCLDYSILRPHLMPHLSSEQQILMVGCGNSKLSEDLYQDGYEEITNIDYSPSVISLMEEKTKASCPKMSWKVADMRNMDGLQDAHYDMVIDKCAMDAIWSDGGSLWDPREETKRDITACVGEFYRVLKPGGTFLFISFGQPHFRKPLLACVGWNIETVQIGMYFMYVMKKPQ